MVTAGEGERERDRLTGEQTEKHSGRQMKTKQVREVSRLRKTHTHTHKNSNVGKRVPARGMKKKKTEAEETPSALQIAEPGH